MKHRLVRIPVLGAAILFFYRLNIGRRYLSAPFAKFIDWLFHSREITNFTYDLEHTNYRYLAAFIAQITHTPYTQIVAYMDELMQNQELAQHIQDNTEKSSEQHLADATVGYGRRIGWYAFVRATKPRTVIETGIDKGLGACVLTAALMKNADENFPGYYYGTDINPDAGYLFTEPYAQFGEILYGDSIESLLRLESTIDLFINDSDHSAEYEQREYETIADKLNQQAIILGDNAHCTDKLLLFALSTQREFLFFQEKPNDHWYPGAGIGVAFAGG